MAAPALSMGAEIGARINTNSDLAASLRQGIQGGMKNRGNAESDADLVRRVGAGDAEAARILVDQHLGRLLGFAQRLLGDHAAAEDVAQESFLRLWRISGKWEPRARVSTWLYRVAHNLCMDQLRKRGRQVDGDVADTARHVPDPGDTPSKAHHRREVSDIVAAAVDTLPPRQRAAIALVHFDGTSNIDAAAVMEVSVEALESLLARGRRTLKKQLTALQPDLMGDSG